MNKNQEKIKQVLRRPTIFVSFIVLCVVIIWGINVTSQSQEKRIDKTLAKQNVDNSKSFDQEEQNLIEILKNKKESSEVILAAIKTLGNKKSTQSIPELIKYLDYEKLYPSRQPENVEGVKVDGFEVGRTITVSGRYPATEALIRISEPALPALVKVIEDEEPNCVRSQNALYTVQQIFVEDWLKAVLYMEKASTESKNPNGSKRLQLAAQKTKAMWDNLQKRN